MGFLTDGLQIGPNGISRPRHRRSSPSRTTSKKHARSPSRSSSLTRGRGGPRGGASSSIASVLLGGLTGETSHNYHKQNSSRGSLFGGGMGYNNSRSSFFNFGNRPSYYKRSPRPNFLQKTLKRLKRLKRLLRDLLRHAKRHPWKVLFLVLMPLLTTGTLAGLLARFGLRIPPSLERLVGIASRAAAGDSLGVVTDAVRMAGHLGRDGNGYGTRTSDVRARAATSERTERWTSDGYARSSGGYRGGYADDYGYGHGYARPGSQRGWQTAAVDMAKSFL